MKIRQGIFESKILAGLRRTHEDVPDEVLVQEARYRLLAKALGWFEDGMTQVGIGKRLGFHPSHVQRKLITVARKNREERKVPPLAAYQGFIGSLMTGDLEPAPAPGAVITPEAMSTAYEVEPAPTTEETEAAIARIQDIMRENLPPAVLDHALADLFPPPRVWHLIQDGNELSLVEPPIPAIPEPYVPTDADRALFATIQDRGPLLGAAVRMVQLAAGIPATGDVDDDTMSVLAGLAAWQGRSRPLLDDVETFMAERRQA